MVANDRATGWQILSDDRERERASSFLARGEHFLLLEHSLHNANVIGGLPTTPALGTKSSDAGTRWVVRSLAWPRERDFLTIGRLDNNDITLAEPSVSKVHAFLRHKDAHVLVSDADSSNGTFVDGRRLGGSREGPISLPSKCKLRLGDVEVVYMNAADLRALLNKP